MEMDGKTPALAVIMATCNRAETLRETLEHICAVDRTGIGVRFYIVDNSSTDRTAEVIESFTERLPVTHLFEPRQGKSYALNHAIEALGNEDIVLFTDDDVTPSEGWFQEIIAVCGRWPGHDMFGGRIDVKYPEGAVVPSWANIHEVSRFAFGRNDCGSHEQVYPPESFPFGANFWLRKTVLADGRRFNTGIGAHPTKTKMGEEIVFLRQLTKEGHEIVFSPGAWVWHRVEKNMLSPWTVLKRAYQRGRGRVYMAGMPHADILLKNRPYWYLLRCMSIVRAFLRLVKAMVTWNADERFGRIISAVTLYGIQIEAMQAVWNERRKQGADA
jgi:glucosyl-dolichyl phosphate glucuronosyltransferase